MKEHGVATLHVHRPAPKQSVLTVRIDAPVPRHVISDRHGVNMTREDDATRQIPAGSRQNIVAES
jgi:hypothetical protein